VCEIRGFVGGEEANKRGYWEVKRFKVQYMFAYGDSISHTLDIEKGWRGREAKGL
jgi:hypothetical protein